MGTIQLSPCWDHHPIQWKFVDANWSFVVDQCELDEHDTFIGWSLWGRRISRGGGAKVGWRAVYVQQLEVRHGGRGIRKNLKSI